MDESMKPLRRKEDEFMREPWGRGTFCALCFGAAYDRISMGSNRKKEEETGKGGNLSGSTGRYKNTEPHALWHPDGAGRRGRHFPEIFFAGCFHPLLSLRIHYRENRRKTAGRAEASHGGKTDPPRANPQNEERKQEGEHYVQGKCCSVFERNGNE